MRNIASRLPIAFIIFCVYFSSIPYLTAQQELQNQNQVSESESNKRALIATSIGHATVYTGAMLLLNKAWYSEHPRSSFHLHDDFYDWYQMDKTGHITSTYHLSRLSYAAFMHTGISNKQAALWGSASGSLFLSTVEILDGFSDEWGASLWDVSANTLGSLSFYLQQVAWQEQRIIWKYSYTQSGMGKYRPDLLGYNLAENLLKDYNGQTHWLSFNLHSIAGGNNSLPVWLNIAIGHSAIGLLGSRYNPQDFNGDLLPEFKRYRQFYISPDIDFARIPTRYKALKGVLNMMNFIKFPAPALEYNQGKGVSFHLVFF